MRKMYFGIILAEINLLLLVAFHFLNILTYNHNIEVFIIFGFPFQANFILDFVLYLIIILQLIIVILWVEKDKKVI